MALLRLSCLFFFTYSPTVLLSPFLGRHLVSIKSSLASSRHACQADATAIDPGVPLPPVSRIVHDGDDLALQVDLLRLPIMLVSEIIEQARRRWRQSRRCWRVRRWRERFRRRGTILRPRRRSRPRRDGDANRHGLGVGPPPWRRDHTRRTGAELR